MTSDSDTCSLDWSGIRRFTHKVTPEIGGAVTLLCGGKHRWTATIREIKETPR